METLQNRAQQAAGNWKRFDSFSWWGRDEDAIPDPENWTVVYTSSRDSSLLAESNTAAIDTEMARYVEDGTVVKESHNHWACGYVDGYAIRVYTRTGKTSHAFVAWCEIQDRLDDYPVLDEDDYSAREYEAHIDNIREVVRLETGEVIDDEQAGAIYEVLPLDNDPTQTYGDTAAILAEAERQGIILPKCDECGERAVQTLPGMCDTCRDENDPAWRADLAAQQYQMGMAI